MPPKQPANNEPLNDFAQFYESGSLFGGSGGIAEKCGCFGVIAEATRIGTAAGGRVDGSMSSMGLPPRSSSLGSGPTAVKKPTAANTSAAKNPISDRFAWAISKCMCLLSE